MGGAFLATHDFGSNVGEATATTLAAPTLRNLRGSILATGQTRKRRQTPALPTRLRPAPQSHDPDLSVASGGGRRNNSIVPGQQVRKRRQRPHLPPKRIRPAPSQSNFLNSHNDEEQLVELFEKEMEAIAVAGNQGNDSNAKSYPFRKPKVQQSRRRHPFSLEEMVCYLNGTGSRVYFIDVSHEISKLMHAR